MLSVQSSSTSVLDSLAICETAVLLYPPPPRKRSSFKGLVSNVLLKCLTQKLDTKVLLPALLILFFTQHPALLTSSSHPVSHLSIGFA